MTELCDADLHTVINSDTPLSTLGYPDFGTTCIKMCSFCSGENGMLLAVCTWESSPLVHASPHEI